MPTGDIFCLLDKIALFAFSVIQDQQSRELSQGHVSKRAKKFRVKKEDLKLKPVISFDCAEIRERDRCNVVTCHTDTAEAYLWRLQNFVIGEHVLKPRPDDPKPVKACAISACGNFAILGTAGGWIEKFNLQSGISRGSYIDNLEKHSCAHDSELVGVACDSTNTLLISAGYHGDLKVWDFKGRELKSRWEIGCSLVKIVYHRFNGLLATVADDLIIRLYDVVALRMVRKFEGHTDRITDVCFSEDGKWLLSSGMDGILRIWDVILARQIDAIHVDVSITALSVSKYGCISNYPRRSKWCLSVIRNKPTEAPKKPEEVPFFLPSVASLSGEVVFNPMKSTSTDDDNKAEETEKHRKLLELPSSRFYHHQVGIIN